MRLYHSHDKLLQSSKSAHRGHTSKRLRSWEGSFLCWYPTHLEWFKGRVIKYLSQTRIFIQLQKTTRRLSPHTPFLFASSPIKVKVLLIANEMIAGAILYLPFGKSSKILGLKSLFIKKNAELYPLQLENPSGQRNYIVLWKLMPFYYFGGFHAA